MVRVYPDPTSLLISRETDKTLFLEVDNQWTIVFESGGAIFNSGKRILPQSETQMLNFPNLVFLCAYALTNIGLVIWKTTLFVRFYGRFRSSMAMYVLGIELFSNCGTSPHPRQHCS